MSRQRTYAVLERTNLAAGMRVVLAVRKHHNPELRRVIALSLEEADWLARDGRLDGWRPFGAPTTPTEET